jgi:hypothetical protein
VKNPVFILTGFFYLSESNVKTFPLNDNVSQTFVIKTDGTKFIKIKKSIL